MLMNWYQIDYSSSLRHKFKSHKIVVYTSSAAVLLQCPFSSRSLSVALGQSMCELDRYCARRQVPVDAAWVGIRVEVHSTAALRRPDRCARIIRNLLIHGIFARRKHKQPRPTSHILVDRRLAAPTAAQEASAPRRTWALLSPSIKVVKPHLWQRQNPVRSRPVATQASRWPNVAEGEHPETLLHAHVNTVWALTSPSRRTRDTLDPRGTSAQGLPGGGRETILCGTDVLLRLLSIVTGDSVSRHRLSRPE